MLRLAVSMARHRVPALLAVAFALLGGSVVVTTVGIVADSGFRSHVIAGRLGGADVLVSASQTYSSADSMAIALPERDRVPQDVVHRLSQLPGVVLAVGDLSFPAAVVDGAGRAISTGDARLAGHGWSSASMLERGHGASPPVDGAPPTGAHDVALGTGTAARAGVHPGDPITVIACGVSQTYRVSGVVGADPTGIYFEDATAAGLAARGTAGSRGSDLAARGTAGSRSFDLVALRTAPGAEESVAAAATS